MDPNSITVETSVQDILNQGGRAKPFMTRLAMMVFNRHDGKSIKAFTQFGPKDLGSVIEAYRKGVFDFGQTIIMTDTGAKFPKDKDAVLKAIELALDGKEGDIDVSTLGINDGDGVDLKKLFPGGQKKAVRKKAAVKKPKANKKPVEEVAEEVAAAADKEELVKSPGVTVSEAPRVVVPPSRSSEGGVAAAIINRIDKLSVDLAEAFQTVVDQTKKIDERRASVIEDEIGWVKKEIGDVKAGILGLLGYLEVIDKNMQTMAIYFVDPDFVFEQPSDATVSLLKQVVPDDIEERVEGKDIDPYPEPRKEPKAEEPEKKAAPTKETTKETKKEAPTNTNGQVEVFTRSQLEEWDLKDLREYAAKLGCTPAKWQKANINRILKEYQKRGLIK